MGLYQYMDQLGKRAEEKRQASIAAEEEVKEAREKAAEAKKQHKENKEQGMI